MAEAGSWPRVRPAGVPVLLLLLLPLPVPLPLLPLLPVHHCTLPHPLHTAAPIVHCYTPLHMSAALEHDPCCSLGSVAANICSL